MLHFMQIEIFYICLSYFIIYDMICVDNKFMDAIIAVDKQSVLSICIRYICLNVYPNSFKSSLIFCLSALSIIVAQLPISLIIICLLVS